MNYTKWQEIERKDGSTKGREFYRLTAKSHIEPTKAIVATTKSGYVAAQCPQLVEITVIDLDDLDNKFVAMPGSPECHTALCQIFASKYPYGI